ncbi:MAG: hypothetical protein PHQ59_00825 [Candidatus Daviesbacteria bacterium]|nr:hypothetical protein [Candidatus Daviesbacteria bacterium]
MNILSRTKGKVIIIVLGIVFIAAAIVYKGSGANTSTSNLMSLSTFMFGIFVAFAIANAHGKIRKINEAINDEEGNTLFIYKSLSLWGEEVEQQAQSLIDDYLIDQIDYYLWDYKYSSKSFMRLFDFIVQLDCKNEAQKILYGNMINALSDSLKKRKQVESLVNERMMPVEWLSVLSLLLVDIIYVFNMNDGSLINIAATILLSVTAIVFIVILRDLDALSWKESTWIWEPLDNLFKEIGLLPYYPDDVIKAGKIKPTTKEKIRLATYPNRYPDMSGKIVSEIEI